MSHSNYIKKDLLALAPLWALILYFLWPLILLKKSFILSDYSVQHLPWAAHYFESLRLNTIPLWTDLIGCGFPLVAEGQVAAFYIFNILSYKFLPFIAAYTWSIPFHILLGGVGMYGYGRVMGLSRPASSLVAVCFAFGSGYSGCFYNTASLRTLCWMPTCLILLEKARHAPVRMKTAGILTIGIIFSQQWLAGFPQMAVYSFFFCLMYELFSLIENGKKPMVGAVGFSSLFFVLAAIVIGTLLALPQILLTFELIAHSVRKGESLGFALWGSVPPLAPVSLLFPQWGNALRLTFYIGTAPLFLVASWLIFRRPGNVTRHLWLCLIFFLMALGKHNPLYGWLVETFSITSMRNPSKFLFFSVTSLSVLAGMGLDCILFQSGDDKRRSGLLKFILGFASLFLALPLAARTAVKLALPFMESFSRSYVARLISEKGEIAKDPEYYLTLIRQFLTSLESLFSYANPLNLESIFLAVSAASLLLLFLFKRLKQGLFIVLFLALVTWDLGFFGQTMGSGFIGNAGPISLLKEPAVVSSLKPFLKPKDLAVEFTKEFKDEEFPPNMNMRFLIPHAGAYSPLLIKRYYDLAKDLGFADSSLGRSVYSLDTWTQQKALLDLMGVNIIRLFAPLALSGKTLVRQTNNEYICRNETSLPFIRGYYQWEVISDPKERLNFIKSTSFNPGQEVILDEPIAIKTDSLSSVLPATDGRLVSDSVSDLSMEITMKADGVALIRQTAYPGWRLEVDQRPRHWFYADHAFLGFVLEKGQHTIRLTYHPTHWFLAWGISIFCWILAAIMILFLLCSKRYNTRRHE